MTTLASPSQGNTTQLSMWSVEMSEGQQGPLHIFDVEQIWHVLDGEVEIAIVADSATLCTGDTIVVAAGVQRQVTARSHARLVVCGRGDAIASIPGEAASRGVPAWIS